MLELIKLFKSIGCEYECDVSIAPYTSFKIGGCCKLLVKPKNLTELTAVFSAVKESNLDYFIMGNGSNLLVSNDGYKGIIILLTSNYSLIKRISNTKICCTSGITLTKLCKFAFENSLSGLEFAFGIPGTVGGAIYMNAGAYGGEIKDILSTCDYIDSETKRVVTAINSDNQLDLSYRHSRFSDKNDCIVSAVFDLKNGNQTDIKTLMDDFMLRRKDKQPLEYPSAGSTFKRPNGAYASALIDECGLKGVTIGDAMVSEKHCGFIINKKNATCDDVIKLIGHVRKVVFEKTGFKLEPEVKTLGFNFQYD